MIDRLEGWSWSIHESGILLQSAAGRIRYQDQQRPLRRARAIVAALPASSAWRASGDWTIERTLTLEHEHAALATQDGHVGDRPARRAVGLVLLDEAYAVVDGIGEREPIARTVRELTLADSHMLGERRRRYVFTPPPWQGLLVRPHHAYFLGPGYPASGVYLVVLPAQPRTLFPGDASALVESLNKQKGWSHGPHRPVAVAHPLANGNGLAGELFEADVREGKIEATRVFAVLEDQRYLYPLLVEAPPARIAEVLPVFRDVVASVEPIPSATRAAAVSHWVE